MAFSPTEIPAMRAKHMLRPSNVVITLVTVVGGPSALAGSPLPSGVATFTPLPDLAGGAFFCDAGGVSHDGRIIVGSGCDNVSASITKPVRWVNDQPESLGLLPGATTGYARDVSANGSTVVGVCSVASTLQAFRFENGTMSSIPGPAGFTSSVVAQGVSDDGSVVAGYGRGSGSPRAFRWLGGVTSPLLDIPGSFDNSAATGISGDGNIVLGRGRSPSFEPFYEACNWFLDGPAIPMGDLSGGAAFSEAFASNFDGSIIVGIGNDASTSGPELDLRVATRWVGNDSPTSLGDLPGGIVRSAAFGLTDDGTAIVGEGRSAIGNEAFLWREGRGIANLKTVLQTEFHLDLGGWTLTRATAITPTGTAIVGYGTNPSGQTQAWIVRFAPPCAGDIDNTGTIDTADLVAFLARFGATSAGAEAADLNNDGSVNTADLVQFLGLFGGAC